jgi:hypothetical protein
VSPRLSRSTIRDLIRAVERAEPDEQWVTLCFVAGRGVELDPDEVSASLRRAELLLATGGDPRRKLELYGRAVTAVADDLDSEGARAELRDGLVALQSEVDGLRGASEALRVLARDTDLAWQCFACALVAEELAAEGADG